MLETLITIKQKSCFYIFIALVIQCNVVCAIDTKKEGANQRNTNIQRISSVKEAANKATSQLREMIRKDMLVTTEQTNNDLQKTQHEEAFVKEGSHADEVAPLTETQHDTTLSVKEAANKATSQLKEMVRKDMLVTTEQTNNDLQKTQHEEAFVKEGSHADEVAPLTETQHDTTLSVKEAANKATSQLKEMMKKNTLFVKEEPHEEAIFVKREEENKDIQPLMPKPQTMPVMSDFFATLAHAYQNNPDLAAAFVEQKSNMEAVPHALSGWRPSLEIRTSQTYDHSKVRDIQSVDKSANSSVVTSYTLFEGFHTAHTVYAAKATTRSGFSDFNAKEQEVLYNAAQAYLQLIKAKATLDIHRSQEGRALEQKKFVAKQVRAGERSPTDLSESDADYQNSVNRRLVAENDLKVQEARFVEIVQATPNINNIKIPELSQEFFPQSLDEAIDLAKIHNPSILKIREEVNYRQSMIGVARSPLLPRVTVSASAGKTLRDKTFARKSLSSSVEMIVPLYPRGGEAWSSLRKSTQEKSKAQKQLNVRQNQVTREVSENWTKLHYATLQLVPLRARIHQAQILLKGRKKEYQSGEKPLLSVLEAEDKLLQAQINLIDTQQEQLNQMCRLLVSVGRFSPGLLKLSVEPYDIKGYYQRVCHKWF